MSVQKSVNEREIMYQDSSMTNPFVINRCCIHSDDASKHYPNGQRKKQSGKLYGGRGQGSGEPVGFEHFF